MRILITNDDGIDAPGIRKLAEAARALGEVWVVAPDGQRSAVSHSFTYKGPVILRAHDFPVSGVRAFSCDGMPADAIRIGVTALMPERPDVVMTGINDGYNIASDIQYSATVGAALEAAFLGIHAIAFSQGFSDADEVVDAYLGPAMEECLRTPPGPNRAWNVNFPGCALADCAGVLRDRAVSCDPFYSDGYVNRELGDGAREYRLTTGRTWDSATPGTDLHAIATNHVSIGTVANFGA